MSSALGRRLYAGVVWLSVISFATAGVLLGLLIAGAAHAGWLAPGSALHLGLGMLAGSIVIALTFVLLPAWGRFSRFGDDMRLIELCDPGAPLLRELLRVAPGTYSHSIVTGSLTEAAASEIGANALLARAGAYYHDIGKVARPQFFTENQQGLRNPHDGASPEQSAMIITAHVREGVAMAREHRLPEALVDIIEQHHGSSLVIYFYRKASACGLEVDQAPFRYECPAPRSKEAALVMLADAAEAAARALADCGPVQIEAAVRRVVDDKIADGQLDEAGMTPADVEATVALYAKMLSGQRHVRVQYPDAEDRGA